MRTCSLVAILTAGCHHAPPRPPPPFPDASPANIVAVTGSIFPAVVRLDVAQEIYADGKRTLRREIGSGVIIDQQGHVLTNYHVAGRAAEIYVTLFSKERVKAKLVGDDHWTDLAIVQLDLDEIAQKHITFSHAPLGDSDSLKVGQPVMAIGTPFGLARTTTLGVVSNTDRTFYPEKQTIDEYETGQFSNWIQMDTPIAPGNSGGPLVDLSGKLVGINTRGFPGQALNFAIPINLAKDVAAEIIRTAPAYAATTQSSATITPGHVTRADLGVDLMPLQDLESFYEVDVNTGVLINSVDRKGPAEKAGLKPQDILLALNGQPVNARFPEEIAPVRRTISRLPVDQNVALLVRRGKQTLTFNTKTEKLEGAVGEERELKDWGLSVRDVTRAYAVQGQLDDDLGVVVTTLTNGFPAAKAEIKPEDVIRSVNQQPVEDLQAFMALYQKAHDAHDTAVLLEIQRGRGLVRAVLRLTATTKPSTKP